MTGVITITARSIGSRRPLFADWSVPLPPDDFSDGGEGGEGLTLRVLIARIVAREVESFALRHERRLHDRVFTREQIDEGVRAGALRPEARRTPAPPSLEEAVAAAHDAFEDGLYLVIVDDREHRALDDRVSLKPDSRVTFVRLVFLAGG